MRMSTYDMIAGRRFYAPLLFTVIFKEALADPKELPRLRDCYFNEKGEVELFSKTGPNAWYGQDENKAYRELPGYLGEGEPCTYDPVYAKWRYEWPKDAAKRLILSRAFEMVGSYDPLAEMQRILGDMKAGKVTPETVRAYKEGEPMVQQIIDILQKKN